MGEVLRNADLSGVRMRGVLLVGADLDGVISGLRVLFGEEWAHHRYAVRDPAGLRRP